jgi:glycosyltransferase involved in cell wall biosynthesis
VIQQPEDHISIAEKITALLNDKNKQEAMSRNARQLAEEFTFKHHIGKIKKLYDTLTIDRHMHT